MTLVCRRLHSTTSASASSIASSFLAHHTSRPPKEYTQTLDSNQLALLHATLDRPQDSSPSTSSSAPAIPPAHHLIYHTPSQATSSLGPDGTDTLYNPTAPFTRRMWAGGEIRWEKENLLRVGQKVKETTGVRSVEAKRTKGGEEMVVVGVEKVFENEAGVAVVDRRNWIFRPEITTPIPPASRPPPVPFPAAAPGTHICDRLQTPLSLFRFSALTFNAHKIHYDRGWCRDVEGHRELVVHGPLNLICMLDFWRDVRGGGAEEVPRSVKYRATSPLYVGEIYRIMMEEKERVAEVRILDSYGNVGMTGEIESF